MSGTITSSNGFLANLPFFDIRGVSERLIDFGSSRRLSEGNDSLRVDGGAVDGRFMGSGTPSCSSGDVT